MLFRSDRRKPPLGDARIGDMARRARGFVGHGVRVGGGVGCRTAFFLGGWGGVCVAQGMGARLGCGVRSNARLLADANFWPEAS